MRIYYGDFVFLCLLMLFGNMVKFVRGSAMAEGSHDAVVSRNSVTTEHPI